MNGKELVGVKEIEAPSKTSFNITVFGEGPYIVDLKIIETYAKRMARILYLGGATTNIK